MQEAKFEANFQKPMADRNRSTHGGEFSKNYVHMRPAGGAINLDQVSKKPSANDGKSRLFGMGSDENQYSGSMVPEIAANKNTGKRILHSNNANSFNNVIGGSYVADIKPLPSAKGISADPLAMLYGGQAPIDMMYYPPIAAQGGY
jgi:hypothetical protein